MSMKQHAPSVDRILARMSMEEKIGQTLAFGFSGVYPHLDILDAITRYHVAGFRVTPRGRKFVRYLKAGSPGAARVIRDPERLERRYGSTITAPRATAEEYANTLNVLRRRSLETGAGVPVYFATDFEGNQSADVFFSGSIGVPDAMGLAASGDPSLCRRTCAAVGRQMKAVGVDWIHSPVLDVNTVPDNPEIGTRSFSPLPEDVTRFALESLRGYTAARVVSTAKHFPGRGHSAADVHYGVAVIDESRKRMDAVHLAPYRALIQDGLPAIMLAHSIFPALDPEREIATLSRAVITDLLRGELGYQGVVMTDSFTMGGLVAKYEVADAAVRCLQAGVDLILLKDESALRGEVFHGLLEAVRTGRLPEDRVEEAVRRVLQVKQRFGLLDGTQGIVDPGAIARTQIELAQEGIAEEAARRATVVLRDREKILPVRPGTRILVVEHVGGLVRSLNDSSAHSGALYEALLAQGCDASFTDFEVAHVDDAWPVIQQMAAEADLVIHTGCYQRGHRDGREVHAHFLSLNKPTVFVCNSPYGLLVDEAHSTVIVTFSAFAAAMRAAADIITGKYSPSGKLTFDPTKIY